MRIEITYHSEKLIPDEMDRALDSLKKNIQENRLEPDKIHLDIEHFRRKILFWIDKNSLKISDGR